MGAGVKRGNALAGLHTARASVFNLTPPLRPAPEGQGVWSKAWGRYACETARGYLRLTPLVGSSFRQ
jgi:hypothetical protein